MIDYMVMEAVAIKVGKEDEKARKAQKRREWRKETSESLEKARG